MDDVQQAIARIKQGDLTGLETLVRKYQVKAVYAAYLVLQDRQMAEDAAQNTFLHLVKRIGQYDDTRPFEPWLMRCVVNAALDAARQTKRWVPLETGADTGETMPVVWLTRSAPCPEDLVETRELRQAVRAALNKLHPEQRAAVVLRYFLEMSEAEMVQALRKPPSTVKWRLHEAKRRLKELLRPVLSSWSSEMREEEKCDE